MTDDVRWFSPNAFGRLVVPALQRSGWSIATDGDRPARLAIAIDGQVALEADRFARRHGAGLVLYLWDLPPWRLGQGRPDWIFRWAGGLRRVPRPTGGYPERAGYYSRLRYLVRHGARVWVPSAATAADVGRRFGVEADRVSYCYDSARFTAGPWNPARPLRLFSVSRLVDTKNHQALIRAAAAMSPKPVVHLIGQGPEAPRLRRLAADLGVTLELVDQWQSDDAVVAGYRAASVVVAPSRFEGFGLTPIEGIAAGIPVAASDIPPHREFLGSAVQYFPPDDDAAVVSAIERALAAGPPPASQVTELAIDAAARRFAERLEAILKSTPTRR